MTKTPCMEHTRRGLERELACTRWLTAAGAVLEGTNAVACSVAKRWRPHLGAN